MTTILSEIEPHLYQSGDPGKELPEDIDVVVNLRTTTHEKYHNKIHAVLHLPTTDGVFKGFDWLDTAVDFIHLKLSSPEHKVLVHCAAGISRSTLVVAAYLMKYRHMTKNQALDEIAVKRPIIGPLPRFIIALQEYEEHLAQQRS